MALWCTQERGKSEEREESNTQREEEAASRADGREAVNEERESEPNSAGAASGVAEVVVFADGTNQGRVVEPSGSSTAASTPSANLNGARRASRRQQSLPPEVKDPNGWVPGNACELPTCLSGFVAPEGPVEQTPEEEGSTEPLFGTDDEDSSTEEES